LLAELEAKGRDLLEAFTETAEMSKPRLTTPSIIALVQRSRSGTASTDAHGDAAIDAMRLAAEKRVQGVPRELTTPALWARGAARRHMRRVCTEETHGRTREVGGWPR
jgi:hypothetical protein